MVRAEIMGDYLLVKTLLLLKDEILELSIEPAFAVTLPAICFPGRTVSDKRFCSRSQQSAATSVR